MSGQYDASFPRDGEAVEDHISNAVYGAFRIITHVQNSLDDIKYNTKSLFWWTSTLVCICLGLFLLAQLVRMREELTTIVQYQEVFRRMWEEDREIKMEWIEEQRRARDTDGRRPRGREGGHSRAGSAYSGGGRGGMFGTEPEPYQ